MKIKMDNDCNNQTTTNNINTINNNLSNDNASSSSSNNNYNLISSINTNSTNIADSSSSSSSTSSPLASSNNNDAAAVSSSANYLENLLQQQFTNNTKLATLARHHNTQMFEHHFHHNHHLASDASNSKYQTNRFNNNTIGQYVDLSNLSNNNPHPPQTLPPTNMCHLQNQPTTAYLVQTPQGSALLIPPAATATSHFNQQAAVNTFSLNRNPYGLTTIPLQNTAISNVNQNLPNSPSITSANCFNNRPESTTSTNVYQTIDTEKNGYLYPLEGFYEGSTFSNNNTCSARHKFKKNYQMQFQMQQQGQFAKLIESNNPSTNNNSSNTLRSNTNNTNSNFFVSPALSATSNRRLSTGSFLQRIKYRFGKKFQAYCSWKCLAILFLFIILNLFLFTIYLSVMRMYNLNWHLKENTANMAAVRHQTNTLYSHEAKIASSSMFFAKIGDTIEDQIHPFEFFNMQFYLDNSVYIKFNLSISKNSHIGFYADKSSAPSFTKFKLFETFDGYSLITKTNSDSNLNKRTITVFDSNMVNTGFVHYLEEGLWYISLLNDNKQPLKFKLKTEFHEQINSNCPMNCFGKGECVNGKCKCFPGFSGLDCSSNTCPVLCSGHGKYENGKCTCDSLWHGTECELPIDQCEVPNCNKNGECMNGKCMCFPGYEGKFCDKKTCAGNCSNNGVCLNGKCICFSNFTGSDCAQLIQSTYSLCSNNGEFDYQTKSCHCSKGWLEPDCSRNENCLDKSCNICKNGWSGLNCQLKVPFSCDSRCNEHGICVNGTCNCSPGFQGRNCDINNCPNSCSLNGICERMGSKYQCICNQGWTGKACDTAIEMVCNDDIDNDGDGLTDCMDSECCVFDNCKLSLACQSSPEPKDRLLRKQPPSLSATFFDKMRFLIEDGSVQSFAYSNSFTESQVSVIRGQVLFKNGQPLIGVKVSSVLNPSYGFTLTRNNGIFDIMINGGGSVQLEFSRNRLKTKIISVNAVWNQFVYIEPVVMHLAEDSENSLIQTSPCKQQLLHDSSLVYAIIKSSWKEIRTHYFENTPILADSGVVRSEINLADTNLKLVYTSNQAQGYTSTIFILLTQQTIPETLQLIHLQIIVEGVLHKQTFDAYSNLKYEFSWDRRNAYEQRVYGFTNAKVMVGYQYEFCSFIYWQTSIVKLAGYDLSSSEIGNWNLDVHHRLNTQQGILHKGDGTTIYLKEIQKSIEITAGQLKKRRDLDCSTQCSLDLKFYSPYSLSINKDGLIFIGDFNFIWMLNNSEPARAVLELKMDQPFKYYISNEPTNGNLYFTHSTNRKILTLKSLEQINDLRNNFKLAKGFCTDSLECDLNSKRVQYPKGIAFDNNGILYFIDGNLIKSINTDGLITTIIGNLDSRINYKPNECNLSYSFDEVQFYWPTVLAVNPVDNSLYILDEQVVYRITSSNRVEIVVGVPYGCNSKERKLNSAIDIAFNSDGDLYVLEKKQILLIKSTGELEVFYTGEGYLKNGYSFDFDTTSFVSFNDPVAIAVHQNKSVYVLDRGDNVLYHIKNTITRDEFSGKYTIVSPDTREAFIFNRFGLHLHTLDLLTGQVMYNFSYNGNALYGKLVSVTDQNKVLLNIKRDFHGRAEFIQTANNFNIRLKLNNFDQLRSLSTSDNKSYNLNYMGNSGLLISKSELNDKTTTFVYEKNGKVKEIIEPNNSITNISYFINSTGLVTVLSKANNFYTQTWLVNSSAMYIYKNDILETQIDTNKSNLNIRTLSNEDSFNSFKIYFKSLYNYKQQQQSSINKLRNEKSFNFNKRNNNIANNRIIK